MLNDVKNCTRNIIKLKKDLKIIYISSVVSKNTLHINAYIKIYIKA